MTTTYTPDKEKWGYLREHSRDASGTDPLTGLHRTGLDEYLAVIYPDVNDWIHDKAFGEHLDGIKHKIRPDYRSEHLKIIVEFDGLPHYQNPDVILKDDKNTAIYTSNGYKVIRIPYFIQLTNQTVKELFDVNANENLFNVNFPSLGGEGMRHNPSYLCPEGLKRMAREFHRFPDQYEINIQALRKMNNPILSGVKLLEEAYNAVK